MFKHLPAQQTLSLILLCGLVSACSSTRKIAGPTSTGAPLARDPEAGIELLAPDARNQTPRQRRTFQENGGKKTLNRIESDFNGDGRIDFIQTYDPTGVWIQSEKSDLDGDGRFDVTYIFVWDAPRKQNRLSEQHFDSNYDGNIDLWKDFDSRGQVILRKLDRNFDGRIDYWEYYSNGQVVRIEQDNNNDGRPDVVPAPRTSRR